MSHPAGTLVPDNQKLPKAKPQPPLAKRATDTEPEPVEGQYYATLFFDETGKPAVDFGDLDVAEALMLLEAAKLLLMTHIVGE